MSIGLGSMFLIAIEYLTGAIWSVPMRRVVEFLTSALWIAPILGLPVILNIALHWFDNFIIVSTISACLGVLSEACEKRSH